MCGAPKEQVVTQKTELDPALRRHLYGGSILNPRGGFGSDTGSSSGNTTAPVTTNVGVGGDGGFGDGGGMGGGYSDNAGVAGGSDFGGGANGGFGDGMGIGGVYAQGGYVQPQQGLASLNQGQMPMMNGQMPNLSDPATAATLAMAVRRPELQYGQVMANPAANQMINGAMSNFAMGGYVEGPGTGTSDSIPSTIYQNGMPVQEARLSDGEFVMTENAVRGAGNGDREAGAARMYEMMRKFENGGRI